jgi:hypothetical protein
MGCHEWQVFCPAIAGGARTDWRRKMKSRLKYARIVIALMIAIGSVGWTAAYAVSGPPFSGWLQLNGGYAQVPYQNEISIDPANGSFTIEGWINNPYFFTDNTHYAVSRQASFALDFWHSQPPSPAHSTYGVAFKSCGDSFCTYTSHVLSECAFIVDCQPQGAYHFAYVYDHATDKGALFLNGVLIGSDEAVPQTSTQPIVLQYAVSMDEFRISNNVRYTAPFTPPSAPYACDGNTQALWHFDEIAGSTTFHDACGTVDNIMSGYNGAHSEGVTGYKVYLPLAIK